MSGVEDGSHRSIDDRLGCGISTSGTTAAKKWFAAFVTPRHEKRVDEHCQVRGIERFLPLFQVRSCWKDGSKHMLQLPLFPSYIFVRIGCGRERLSVLQIPGVKSIVGAGKMMLPVPDAYIHCLQHGLRQGVIEPHPYLTVGKQVRIRSGAMAGMEGILIAHKNRFRVVLALDFIMRSVKVEVELGDIDPVNAATAFHTPASTLAA
jgi:transcription antitermination factor NusG